MSKPAPYEPKPMKISVLTAALQELTPREKRDPDPDLAIEEWLAFSRDIGSPFIQLSAASILLQTRWIFANPSTKSARRAWQQR
jgi:hypothetical protein